MRRHAAGAPASAVALALALTATLAGCGSGGRELFVLERTGTIPGARLSLRVLDDGLVACNGGAERRLGDDQLLRAREIERELGDEARAGLRLAPGPGVVLTYRVRLHKGSLSFADTSRGLGPELLLVPAFARSVAKGVCGLPR